MVEYKESIREDVMKALEHGIVMDPEIAVKVVEIKETNSFHNGVCLRMSRSKFLLYNQTETDLLLCRFNHSCRANAEHFWNEDLQAREVI